MIKYFTFSFLMLATTLGFAQGYDLPVTFDDGAVTYGVVDFGGNASSVVADPTNAANMVVKSEKTGTAELWAGTTVGIDVAGKVTSFKTKLPFTSTDTKMSIKVWSPDAGIQVRFKVEDASDPTKSVETEATTTKANAWEVLVFDFSSEASGTAALNLGYTYDKGSVFFNFGVTGQTAGAKIYYWDDITFVTAGASKSQINLPVTFEDTTVDYTLTDFGDMASSIVADPAGGMNMVAKSIKVASSPVWAGVTAGTPSGFKDAIPFTAMETKMTVRIYSADAGVPVRLKVEESGDPTKSCETEVKTTKANEWEDVIFDFSNHVDGTAALNLAYTFDKASIFFNFGTDGATAGEKTYHWDDMIFGEPAKDQINLPVTFEDTTVDYTLTDFGDMASSIVADPAGGMNMVAKSIKVASSPVWAGVTAGTPSGFKDAIPFTAMETKMTVRIYSADAGVPVRLKVEESGDPTKSCETEVKTTKANEWEDVIFDFSNHVDGTAALNLAFTFDKASIFFNFGTDGATAGEKTYHWDDMMFGEPVNTSVKELTSGSITYYPNPVTNVLNIATTNAMNHVTVMNAVGAVVESFDANSAALSLDMTAYTSGIYVVVVETSNETLSFKASKN